MYDIVVKLTKKDGYFVMPHSDSASGGVKYRNASEFNVTGFRVKRGMTINQRLLKKLN